jgi:glyoxylase I family protein
MGSSQFHHVALNCQDMEGVEAWYGRHFGFRRARAIPIEGGQIVFLKSGSTYLELFQADGDRPGGAPGKDGPAQPGVRHVAFKVEDVDAQLEAMGADAKVTLGPLSFDGVIPGWRTAWVSDPDGNIVEISQGFQDEAGAEVGG